MCAKCVSLPRTVEVTTTLTNTVDDTGISQLKTPKNNCASLASTHEFAVKSTYITLILPLYMINAP